MKASVLDIRLSDLPTALQYLFFGNSAFLLGKEELDGACRLGRHKTCILSYEEGGQLLWAQR